MDGKLPGKFERTHTEIQFMHKKNLTPFYFITLYFCNSSTGKKIYNRLILSADYIGALQKTFVHDMKFVIVGTDRFLRQFYFNARQSIQSHRPNILIQFSTMIKLPQNYVKLIPSIRQLKQNDSLRINELR